MVVVLVNDDMESGTLPPATMLLHSNEPIHPMPSSDSPMNQFSDIFSSRQPVQISNKPNKRKLDELSDPSSTDLESSSAIKPQKTEQTEPERSLSRTGTRKTDLFDVIFIIKRTNCLLFF